ncbi:putative copper homeostasis (lipo)protein LpqS [Mycolicibacterium gilvum]
MVTKLWSLSTIAVGERQNRASERVQSDAHSIVRYGPACGTSPQRYLLPGVIRATLGIVKVTGRAARRLRCAAVIAVAALAVLLGTEVGLPHADAVESHGVHVLQASSFTQAASPLITDHSHLMPDKECHSAPPDVLTCAAGLRAETDRTALAISAIAVVVVMGAWAALGATRGPPSVLLGFSAGRPLLIRNCIARR